MLQLFRRKERVAPKPLDSLLNSNAPPTEEQRRKVNLALRNLKSDYEKACGVAYSPTNPILEPGQKYHDEINLHQRALSSIRKLQTDSWHAIFEFSVLSIEPTSQLSMVGIIRLVSQTWNDAAVNCPTLWRNLPSMDLSTMPVSMDPDSIFEASNWALHHHLDRSGTLSISFSFRFSPDDAGLSDDKERRMREIEAKEWVSVLAQESHRWNVVEFQITGSVSRPLWDRLRVSGRVPLLSNFVYQRRGFDFRNRKTNRVLEHLDFSIAPNLRHVLFDSLGLNQGASNLSIEGAKTHLLLPWEQLETFECATQDDTMYPKLLSQGEKLQVLKYTSNKSDTLPSNRTSLHHLTKLSLCFGEYLHGERLVEHLKCFVLPSLKELEIYWGNKLDHVDIYGGISSLIRRSGCTLERLATEHKNLNYDFEGQIERFQEVLYQCPSLTHLDIAYLDAANLDALIPHQNRARKPPLPDLRVLTLRSHRGQGSMDPIPLLKVFFGRTNPSRKPPNSHLEDVYVKHDDHDMWRNVVLELGRPDGATTLPTPFDPELYSTALTWKMELLSTPLTNANAASVTNVMGKGLGQALAEMGTFNLEGRDTRVLTWLGIPALLDSIGREKREKLLRKRHPVQAQYRERAEEILTKWKPFLLADFRVSPHRYCFTDKTTSRLKYVEKPLDDFKESKKEHADAFDPELALANEEEDWDRILGRGDTDPWASTSKGPTWLPMRGWEYPEDPKEDGNYV